MSDDAVCDVRACDAGVRTGAADAARRPCDVDVDVDVDVVRCARSALSPCDVTRVRVLSCVRTCAADACVGCAYGRILHTHVHDTCRLMSCNEAWQQMRST